MFTPIFIILNSNIFENQYKISKSRMNTDNYSNLTLVEERYSDLIKLYKVGIDVLPGEKLVDYIDRNSNEKIKIYQFCMKYSSACRVLNEIYFIPSIKKSSMFGEGLGAGTTAVSIIKKVDRFSLGEAENHRILGELGYLFGTTFLTIKYLFVIFLNFMFFFTKKVTNKLFYFPLLTFVSVALTIGPITYTTSFISFISWFSLGLILNSFNKTNETI